MRNIFFSFVVLFVTLQAQAQNEQALLKSIKAKLDKVTDYTATGTMDVDISFVKAPASGITVYYKKPDQFKIIKQDGLSILPKGGVSMNIGALLSGENYAAVPAGQAVVNGVPTKIIKLLPLTEGSEIVLSTLYVDEKALLVRKAQVTTRENGSYEMDFSFGKYAAWGLPDKVVFSFNAKAYKIPKGLTFEYEKGGSKKEPPKDAKGRIVITYASYAINKGINNRVFAAN